MSIKYMEREFGMSVNEMERELGMSVKDMEREFGKGMKAMERERARHTYINTMVIYIYIILYICMTPNNVRCVTWMQLVMNTIMC